MLIVAVEALKAEAQTLTPELETLGGVPFPA